MSSARPDSRDRSRAGLAAIFSHFGRCDVPPIGSPLYETLCAHIAGNDALLALAAHTPAEQPAPNQLLAAVHYLLLSGEQHPLRDHYPGLTAPGSPERDRAITTLAPAHFDDFCRTHAAAIEALIRTRRTQTNVVRRAAILLPAFAQVLAVGRGRPLAQIEIGCSAGLNLNWNRFHYDYNGPDGRVARSWGDPAAAVQLDIELRGEQRFAELPAEIPVASSTGVDLSPIDPADPDALLWLHALIWPEHAARHARLQAAAELARVHPPRMLAADAGEALPRLLEALPDDVTPCVFATFTLYQFEESSLRALFTALKAHGRRRPVHFIGCEHTGDDCSELWWTCWAPAGKTRERLATAHPHGHWLKWCAPGAS